MNFVIISITFLLSTLVSIYIKKISKSKAISMWVAFGLNTIILISASWLVYYLDEEAALFGLAQTRFSILLFFIPVLTWVNFIILQFIKIEK